MDCLFIAVFDSLGQILLFTVPRSLMLYPDVTTMLNVLLASKNPIKSVKKKNSVVNIALILHYTRVGASSSAGKGLMQGAELVGSGGRQYRINLL